MSSASAAGTPSGAGRAARGEVLDQPAGDRRREQRVAGGDDADRVEQPVGGRVLEQEAAGADPQRLVDVLVAVEGREHHDARCRGPGRRGSARAACEAVELGHADVHQHHVGAPAAHDVDRGAPSAASPTTLMSGSASRITRKPVRSSRWSSAITTRDRPRAAAPRRRRGLVAVAPSRQRDLRDRHAARASPAAAARPRAGSGSAPRGPAIWRTTSEARISPGVGGVAQPAGDDRPACRRGRRRRRPARPRRARSRSAARRGRRRSSRAAWRPRSARRRPRSVNATISPSPVDLTSRPPCSATAARSASKCVAAQRVGAPRRRRRSNSGGRADEVGEQHRDERGRPRREHHRRPAAPRHPRG